MNLFVQGMRRSGTTILYDALLEDPELRCFYEPLREEKVTVGGGSGARDSDAFAETRALRAGFARDRYPGLALEEFNWGGPRKPRLELEPDLPGHCREWLRHLLQMAPAVAIKETRLYSKVGELAALDPGAALVHVVRDPRAVVASIVLGRGRRHLERFPTPDDFFADRSERKLWSSRPLSRHLLKLPQHAGIEDPSNVVRVLLVWLATFERTRAGGLERFGERYVLVRNEDLRTDPGGELARIYGVLGREVPVPVRAWAEGNVREPEEPYAAGDPRWAQAIDQAGARDAVDQAGYGDRIAAAG